MRKVTGVVFLKREYEKAKMQQRFDFDMFSKRKGLKQLNGGGHK